MIREDYFNKIIAIILVIAFFVGSLLSFFSSRDQKLDTINGIDIYYSDTYNARKVLNIYSQDPIKDAYYRKLLAKDATQVANCFVKRVFERSDRSQSIKTIDPQILNQIKTHFLLQTYTDTEFILPYEQLSIFNETSNDYRIVLCKAPQEDIEISRDILYSYYLDNLAQYSAKEFIYKKREVLNSEELLNKIFEKNTDQFFRPETRSGVFVLSNDIDVTLDNILQNEYHKEQIISLINAGTIQDPVSSNLFLLEQVGDYYNFKNNLYLILTDITYREQLQLEDVIINDQFQALVKNSKKMFFLSSNTSTEAFLEDLGPDNIVIKNKKLYYLEKMSEGILPQENYFNTFYNKIRLDYINSVKLDRALLFFHNTDSVKDFTEFNINDSSKNFLNDYNTVLGTLAPNQFYLMNIAGSLYFIKLITTTTGSKQSFNMNILNDYLFILNNREQT